MFKHINLNIFFGYFKKIFVRFQLQFLSVFICRKTLRFFLVINPTMKVLTQGEKLARGKLSWE